MSKIPVNSQKFPPAPAAAHQDPALWDRAPEKSTIFLILNGLNRKTHSESMQSSFFRHQCRLVELIDIPLLRKEAFRINEVLTVQE
jgi:hypothetical protein